MSHGDLLLRFADAALKGTADELAAVRREVESRMGPQQLSDAAAIIAIFCCNVRVADATGIPLDERNAELRQETARVIGIRRFDESPEATS